MEVSALTSHNSKITRSAQVAAGAFAPVFALPTSWGPDVRQFGKFKWRTPERAADKLSGHKGRPTSGNPER